MTGLSKGPHRKRSKNEPVRLRTKYIDHSRRFLEWVNSLGFEQTVIGRVFTQLDERFAIRRIAILFVFALALSFLLFYEFDFAYHVREGEVASADIKSPISLQIVDDKATEAKRAEAEAGVLPVFDYDPQTFEGAIARVYKSFRTMRDLVRATPWPSNEGRREEKIKDFLVNKKQFEDELGVKITDRQFEWLVEQRFGAKIENVVVRALSNWSVHKIADGPRSVLKANEGSVVIRELVPNGSGDEFTVDVSGIRDLRSRSDFSFEGVRGLTRLDARDKRMATQLAHALVMPNITFNRQETTKRRQKAIESIRPVQMAIGKGQTIVGAGSVVQSSHIAILNEIRKLRADHRTEAIALVAAFLFVIVILVLFSYLRRFTTNKVRVEIKDVAVMGVVTVAVIVITKLFLFMTDAAFLSKFGSLIPASVFLFSAPIAAGPMMVGLLITSGEVVWLFTAFLAISLAIMVDLNFTFLLMAMIGGIAAARGVYGCKKRNDIYWAGLRTGLINAAVIASMLIVSRLGSGNLLQELVWTVPAGFVGGILSSMIAMMIIPLLETAFNYTTDVKLLELSSLNHPLMKQMVVRAPGTYHHSLSVGIMVEEAAERIEANALLAKVMAYYHDIGKMEHPQYFIENQKPGYNAHDHVSPYMSKTILIAHVKDGAELGLKHKLGKPIIDGILQHHGTTLISYFYNKALEEQDEDIDNVEESDFRYPGPKPQFKEAALVMLADSIEAAARSIDEPTATRLTNLVRNIIHGKFVDGQLDECNLTLRDLSVIESAFKKTLLSIYHQRIDYPHLDNLTGVTRIAEKRSKKGTVNA